MTIDLGSAGWSPDEIPGRRMPAGTRRAIGAVLLIMVSVLTLGASAPRAPGLDEPLWTVSGKNAFLLDPEGAYLLDEADRSVLAVDPMTGSPRWRRVLHETPVAATVPVAGVVAVVVLPRSFMAERPSTVLLRASTGETLATISGAIVIPPGAGTIAVFSAGRVTSDPACRDFIERVCLDVVAADAHTGRVAWSESLPAGTELVPDLSAPSTPDRITLVDSDGRLVVRDSASGAVLVERTLPGWRDAESAGIPATQRRAVLIGGAAVTVVSRPESAGEPVHVVAVSVFDVASGRRTWSTALRLANLVDGPGGPYVSVDGCGDAVCVLGNAAATVLDLTTGAVRFTVPAAQVWRPSGSDLLLASRFGAPRPGVSSLPTWGLAVIDPRTGVERIRLGPSSKVDWSDPPRGGLLLMRYGRDRTDILWLDGERPVTLGSVPGGDLVCQAAGFLLGCQTRDGVVTLWRLPIDAWEVR